MQTPNANIHMYQALGVLYFSYNIITDGPFVGKIVWPIRE